MLQATYLENKKKCWIPGGPLGWEKTIPTKTNCKTNMFAEAHFCSQVCSVGYIWWVWNHHKYLASSWGIRVVQSWGRVLLWDGRSCPIYDISSIWRVYSSVLTRWKHSWDVQNSPPQILVSNGILGCSFVPDVRSKMLYVYIDLYIEYHMCIYGIWIFTKPMHNQYIF